MTKGMISAFGRSAVNMLKGRTIRHLLHEPKTTEHYHVVAAHADDELALYKVLERIGSHPELEASFTLLTNGTQGYDPPVKVRGRRIATREEYGSLRVEEFNDSLNRFGFEGRSIDGILDEATIFEKLVSDDYESLFPLLDRALDNIKLFMERKPNAVFVDDFTGGHIIHDLANFLVCQAARETGYSPVIEYLQPFGIVDGGSYQIIVGELGHDTRGRVNGQVGTYPVDFPSLGIKDGTLYMSPFELFHLLHHKNLIYSSQHKSLYRCKSNAEIRAIEKPMFREVDTCSIDHTMKPSHGVFYEQASWRKRQLEGLPTFDHFRKLVEGYQTYREAKKAS